MVRTAGSPLWVMLVANAVVASETFFVACFFEGSLCRSRLCRLPQLGTLHVLLSQSFDRWPVLKQMSQSRYVWTCSRRSFTFIDLNFLQIQMGCCPSLNGQTKFLGLVESSAFEAKVLVFGLSRLWKLFLSNDEFVCANKFSWISALEASHSLKTIRLPLSSRRFCIYCNHSFLSCGESFLVAELSPPSDSRSDVYPSWVRVFTTFANTFAKLTMFV